MNTLDWLFDHFVGPAMGWMVVVFLAGLILALPFLAWGAWQDHKSPTFALRKDEWSCSMSHREVYTTTMMVGKVAVPQVHTRTVCDDWRRNGR